MIVEPDAFQRRTIDQVRRFHRRFSRVLTCNARLLGTIENAVFFIGATTWVTDWRTHDMSKSRMLSLIASEKRFLPGHRLRHDAVTMIRQDHVNADVMGRGYRPFDLKADGLAPYRYSVVIENAREPNYFTEKLVDALLCKTVPIYWGAPNIGDFFDTSGILVCENLEDIRRHIGTVSEADYLERLPAIDRNRQLAADYESVEINASRTLLAASTGNPG